MPATMTRPSLVSWGRAPGRSTRPSLVMAGRIVAGRSAADNGAGHVVAGRSATEVFPGSRRSSRAAYASFTLGVLEMTEFPCFCGRSETETFSDPLFVFDRRSRWETLVVMESPTTPGGSTDARDAMKTSIAPGGSVGALDGAGERDGDAGDNDNAVAGSAVAMMSLLASSLVLD